MLREEILKKVKRIEITTRKVVDDVMSGHYRSHFKGHGVQFSEHRQYAHGDDIRHIDWKVSARSKEPVIKKFEEERELTVLLVVDISASESFGSGKYIKGEVAAEVAGMIAYAAIHTGDKVGLELFSDQAELIVPPKKGRTHVLRLIREILGFEAKHKMTNLELALQSADRILKHKSVVFVISDFMDEKYDVALKRLSRKHDVVCVWIRDERESKIPDLGHIYFHDPETGKSGFADTSSYAFKRWLDDVVQNQQKRTTETFKSAGVEVLPIHTKEDYAEAVVRFFAARKRHRRRVTPGR